MEELKKIIPKFTPIKNPGSHGAIIDSNKFMNNISDWFKEINEVIAIIEKK
ncbi:MAG: hypothetical protein GF364_13515 [Candidatus Lokiarchaeota archaeon]|nr:hypothetical protein [Candidatus Lokiarchaeota archaeon]